MVNNILHTKTKILLNNMDISVSDTNLPTNIIIQTEIQTIRIPINPILNMVYIRNIPNNRNILIKLKKIQTYLFIIYQNQNHI